MSAIASMFPPVTTTTPASSTSDALRSAVPAAVTVPTATTVTTAETPTLTVTGEGTVNVAPDQATVSLGATVQATDAAVAVEQVNQIMTRAIAAIKAVGIPSDQIQTVGLSLTPVVASEPTPLPASTLPAATTVSSTGGGPSSGALTSGVNSFMPTTVEGAPGGNASLAPSGTANAGNAANAGSTGNTALPVMNLGPTIVGFRASNTVQVTVNDLTKLGPVIDAGVGAGANEVQGVSFGLQNEGPARQQALQAAVKDAQAKAAALAQALGLTLGSVQQVSEGVQVVQPFGVTAAVASGAGVGTPTPVQPGQVSVNGNVTVVYRV